MSADTGRVKTSRFCSDSEKQKQVLQGTVIFCVLEINWLAARGTFFSSSKTTCYIAATSCWVLKSKGTPLKLDSLRFKAHKKLDGSTDLLEFLLMVMLRLITRNVGDKVLHSEGTLFQSVSITLKICKVVRLPEIRDIDFFGAEDMAFMQKTEYNKMPLTDESIMNFLILNNSYLKWFKNNYNVFYGTPLIDIPESLTQCEKLFDKNVLPIKKLVKYI